MTRSGQWVWSARSAGLVFLLALIVLTLPVWLWYVKQERQLETVQTGGIVMHARTGNDYLQVFTQGKWRDLLIKGVNMGIAKPGYFPGETAITKAEYFRWFRQIGAMNANTVRVYTLHPPAFYEALYEYNETAPQPLYLLQGVWVNEEEFVQAGDAFADAVTSDFRNEIGRIVDAVHGKATVPQRAGHASGTYSRDISPYLLGWVIGIEWDGQAVHSTNVKHAGMSDFTGSFFRTKQAEPFEIWLAQMLDFTAGYESSAYGWQRPMSFTNWVTTDLLKHPSEPSEREDMASVDPNAIEPMESFHAGYFASYHVYPYYPDFMNYEPRYTEYVDRRGQKNNYAGYLHDMKQAHPMPMLVAEFGVPASRGITHRNVYGMNQGFLSEREQGEIDARLFADIVDEKMAGGLVFTWQDEWFKRTWNTMDYDDPDRRPFWSNAQTNEQQFGLLSFDPGKGEQSVIQVDGQPDDWEKARIAPLYEKEAAKPAGAGGVTASIQKLYVTSDERYVYMRLDFDTETIDWNTTNSVILLDTLPGQGQSALPFPSDMTTDAGFDFAVQLVGPERSNIVVDSYYDSFYYHYGHQLRMIPPADYASTINNGTYHPLRLTLNKELSIPRPGGERQKVPFEYVETGRLKFGNANPQSPDYDSLADVAVGKNVVELRIPWLMLNVKDPSARTVMGDLWKTGLGGAVRTDGFAISALTFKPGQQARIADAFPRLTGGQLAAQQMKTYTWPVWETPTYHERLKQSYYRMKETFGSIR